MWCVINSSIDLVHAVDLGDALRNTDQELINVILFGVFLIQYLLEESLQVFVLRNLTVSCVDGIDITVDTEFYPFDPDRFVEFTIEETTIFLDEVVDSKNLWTF